MTFIKQRTKDVVIIMNIEVLLVYLDKLISPNMFIIDLRKIQHDHVYASILRLLSDDLGYHLFNNIPKISSHTSGLISTAVREELYDVLTTGISKSLDIETRYYVETYIVNSDVHIIFSKIKE